MTAFLIDGTLRGTVLSHDVGKASLKTKIISKDKGDSVGFDLGEKAFTIFRGRTGRHRWVTRNGEYNDISILGTSGSEGRNYVTNQRGMLGTGPQG
jgi:hypothetical protein